MEDGVVYEVWGRGSRFLGRIGADWTVGVRWRGELWGGDGDVEDGEGAPETRLRGYGVRVGTESEGRVVACESEC